MLRLVPVFCLFFLLCACGTQPYVPAEYPLRDGLIPAFDIKGTVVVSNAQASSDPVIVSSYGGTKLSSNLAVITEVMVQQTRKELNKNGNLSESPKQKTIALKVDSLVSDYVAFFWKSNSVFQVTLGDGQKFEFKVPHTSGLLLQDLNGCIAEGVMTLLNDPRVTAYLAS